MLKKGKLLSPKQSPDLLRILYIGIVELLLISFFWMFTVRYAYAYTILAIVSLCLVIWSLKKFNLRYSNISIKETVFVIYILSFVIRYSYCLFMESMINQVSDFSIILNTAYNGKFTDALDYYRIYIHKFLYPFILHLLGFISQKRVLLFQCICLSFIPVLLFYIGKKIADIEVGIFAAIIYIFWPAQIVYSQIITEEHIAALLVLSIVICVINTLEKIKLIQDFSEKKVIMKIGVLAGICGILCGICAFFKDWATVIIVAMLICVLYLLIKAAKWQKFAIIFFMIVLMLSRVGTYRAIMCIGEKKLGVNASNAIIVIEMFSALDPNSYGGYNQKLNDQYLQIARKNNFDFSKTNKEAMTILIDKIKDNPDKMPPLLLNKGKDSYSSDFSMLYWALDVETNDIFKNNFTWLRDLLVFQDHIYYLMIVLSIMLYMLLPKKEIIYFIRLIILGGIFVSLIVESQGRYKYSIEPLWCIPSSYVLLYLSKVSSTFENEIETYSRVIMKKLGKFKFDKKNN